MMSKLVPERRFNEFSGEWDKKTFFEVAPLQRGFDLPTTKIQSGNIPVVYSNGIVNYHNKAMVKAPGVVTGRSGTIGKFHYIKEDYWPHNTSLWVTDFKLNNPKFIYYLYQTIDIDNLATRAGVPTLNRNSVHSYNICLPSIKKEQQKIANCLSSLDSLIEAQNKKVETLKAHKKGLMQQLFPSEGETLPKLRFDGFSGEWEEKSLEEVGDIITGNTPKTNEPNNYGNDILFVSPADISEHRYIYETNKKLSYKGFTKTRPIKAKSILVVCIGSTIGKVAQSKLECATNQQINSIVPFDDYCNDFIYSTLEKNAKRIKGMAGNHAVPIINKTAFSGIKVLVPNTKSEQEKIANILSSLDTLIEEGNKKIEALKEHKKGLMQQLFVSSEVEV